MNWLKRNLFLVLGGVAALALLGLAGFYLYQQRQKEIQVTTALEAQITEWKRLTSRNPSANEENIKAAQQEQIKLAELLQANRKFFVPAGTFTNMDSATFKTLLENTIFDLEQLALQQGVNVPKGYNYTATWLRQSVVFKETELIPLAYQLVEIRALCEILFNARIHSLVRIRRVPVSKQDTGSTEYLTGKKVVTNAVTGAVVTPYEVTFQAFTPELAEVLAGMQRSEHCFMVKMLDVEEAEAPEMQLLERDSVYPITPGPTPVTPQTSTDLMRDRYGIGGRSSSESLMQNRYGIGGRSGSESLMQNRYGRSAGGGASAGYRNRYGLTPGGTVGPGSRYAPQPTPGVPGVGYAPAAPVRRGPETVLQEQQLKVTLTVEAVRLPPPAA